MYSFKKSLNGLTLLEVMIALSLLVIGIMGTVAAVNSSMVMRAQNHEMIIAVGEAQQILSAIEMYNLENGVTACWEKFSNFGSNNPLSFNIAFAENSADERKYPLKPAPGNPSNQVAWVEFPESPNDTLNETITGDLAKDFGASWDLNGDGDTDDTFDPSMSEVELQSLPVRITLRWEGRFGVKEFKLVSVLVKVQ